MISGTVRPDGAATIRLIVRGEDEQEQEVEAIIDTGFTGCLSLSPTVIASLGLAWRGYAEAILADGSLHTFEVYSATVIWDAQERTVEVDRADTVALLGMGLIYKHDLRIEAVAGGSVTITALSSDRNTGS